MGHHRCYAGSWVGKRYPSRSILRGIQPATNLTHWELYVLSMSVVVKMVFGSSQSVCQYWIGWNLHSPDQSQDGDSEGTNDLG
jgi:hypothetical protein